MSDIEGTVEGFRTEADALRFVCKQIIGLGQDLKAGRNDEFKKRLTAIYEFAENYLAFSEKPETPDERVTICEGPAFISELRIDNCQYVFDSPVKLESGEQINVAELLEKNAHKMHTPYP